MSPRQIIIIPISEKFRYYANDVYKELHSKYYYVDVDISDQKLNKKILDAEIARYNIILIVGEKEVNNKSVNVRYRDKKDKKNHKEEKSLDDLLIELGEMIKNYM